MANKNVSNATKKTIKKETVVNKDDTIIQIANEPQKDIIQEQPKKNIIQEQPKKDVIQEKSQKTINDLSYDQLKLFKRTGKMPK